MSERTYSEKLAYIEGMMRAMEILAREAERQEMARIHREQLARPRGIRITPKPKPDLFDRFCGFITGEGWL